MAICRPLRREHADPTNATLDCRSGSSGDRFRVGSSRYQAETAADRGSHLWVMFSDSTGEDQQVDPVEGYGHGRYLFAN